MSYRLLFDYSSENKPPVLANMNGQSLQMDGYIIGSYQDPHWKPYPKVEYPSIRNRLPIGYAITDYQWDSNHYALYMPDNSDPIRSYSKLLEAHFEQVHRYSQQDARAQRQVQEAAAESQRQQEYEFNRQKVIQIKSLIEETKKRIKLLETEFKKFQDSGARSVRADIRSGMSETNAQAKFLSMNPRAVQLQPSIDAEKTNLASLKNELKTYQ